jgi:NAD(P)H dehydrogenase (quinone)
MIEYLGMDALEPFVAYGAPRVDSEARKAYLQQWCGRLNEIASNVTPR